MKRVIIVLIAAVCAVKLSGQPLTQSELAWGNLISSGSGSNCTAPSSFTLSAFWTGYEGQIDVSSGSAGGSPPTVYRLYRDTVSGFLNNSGNLIISPPNPILFIDELPSNNVTYYYHATASNDCGLPSSPEVSVFSPLFSLWLDALYGVTLSGGSVIGWADKGPLNHFATNVTTTTTGPPGSPFLITNGPTAGTLAVTVTSGETWFATINNMPSLSSPFSVFAVFDQQNAQTFNLDDLDYNNSSQVISSDYRNVTFGSSTVEVVNNTNGESFVVSTTNYTPWEIASIVFQGTSGSYVRINGITQSNVVANNLPSVTISNLFLTIIGGGGLGTSNGLAEIIVVTNALNTNSCTTIEGYLNGKYHIY
jgi:hypothetical protein